MEETIKIGIAALVFVIALSQKEKIGKSIAKIKGDLEYNTQILYFVILLCGGGSYMLSDLTYGFFVPTETQNITINKAQKTDTEVITEGAIEVIGLGDDLIKEHKEKKRIEDSIYKANKPKYWVYQIGEPVSDEKIILQTYQQLDSVLKESVKIFQSIDKNYVLYIKPDMENSEQTFKDSLDSYKSNFEKRLKAQNLLIGKGCDKVVVGKTLKKRINKEKVVVPCSICE